MKTILIWCESSNGIIGTTDGEKYKLPWKEHDKDDMKHFRQITINNIVLMGYNTWVSLGCKVLSERYNLILTKNHADEFLPYIDKSFEEHDKTTWYKGLSRDLAKKYPNAITDERHLNMWLDFFANDFVGNDSSKKDKCDTDLVVIGGKSLYEKFISKADIVYKTIRNESYLPINTMIKLSLDLEKEGFELTNEKIFNNCKIQTWIRKK